jgi:hypothetical protein
MTTLTIIAACLATIAACLALTFYIYFVVEFALWLGRVADTFWYGSRPWVDTFVVVTLTVAPFAILVEVVT